MKAALILVVFGVCVALSMGIENCYTIDVCEVDECCVKTGNFIGQCEKRKAEGDDCGLFDLKDLFKSNVYLHQCPCEEGLTCVWNEDLVGVWCLYSGIYFGCQNSIQYQQAPEWYTLKLNDKAPCWNLPSHLEKLPIKMEEEWNKY